MNTITREEAAALMEAATPGEWLVVLSDNATPHIMHDGGNDWTDVSDLGSLVVTMPAEITQRFNSRNNAAIMCASKSLAHTVVALNDRIAELEATLAAERGDPAGALPGWCAIGQTWNRDGAAVDRCCVSGTTGWCFHLPRAFGAFGPYPTAREAMRAADAAVTP